MMRLAGIKLEPWRNSYRGYPKPPILRQWDTPASVTYWHFCTSNMGILFGRLSTRFSVGTSKSFIRMPLARFWRISSIWLSVSFGLAPNLTPLALALAIPSSWRSFRISVSNSAMDASLLNSSLPVGVEVSIFWSVTTSSTPFSLRPSAIWVKWNVECAGKYT